MKKLFIYICLFVTFVFVGLINFDEEVLFFLAFVTIVFTSVRMFGESLALQLDIAVFSIVKEFLVLAAVKSLSLVTIKTYSLKVRDLSSEVESLILYTNRTVKLFADSYQADFNKSFQLLKHKQLKLLTLEGLQLIRLLYIRRSLIYWKELRNQLLNSLAFSDAFVLPEGSSNEVMLLSKALYGQLNNLTIAGEEYRGDKDLKSYNIINYFDLVVFVLLLRILNNTK
jgi:hypothetical protein